MDHVPEPRPETTPDETETLDVPANDDVGHVRTLARLNNQAAYLMKQGRYGGAIRLLARALKTLSRSMIHEDQEMEPASTSQDLASCGATFVTAPPRRDQDHPQSNAAKAPFLPGPLILSSTLELEQGTGDALSYVVLYNIGLCWHMEGLAMPVSPCPQRAMTLNKALDLYTLAHSILTSGRVSADPVHYMALVSNMGHVYGLIGEQLDADNCIQMLLQIVLCVVDQKVCCGENFSQAHEPVTATHDGEDAALDGFISIVLRIVLKDLCAPAA